MMSRPLVRAGVVALATYALGLGGFSLVVSPHWARPADVSDDQVLDAVQAWLSACADAQGAYPSNCPQSAQDLQSARAQGFVWHAAQPLMDTVQLEWSGATGVFKTQGRVFMRYEHDRLLSNGEVQHYGGNVAFPFVAGLRWTGDQRRFGAYEFRPGLPIFNGFAIQDFGERRLRCCDGRDLEGVSLKPQGRSSSRTQT